MAPDPTDDMPADEYLKEPIDREELAESRR